MQKQRFTLFVFLLSALHLSAQSTDLPTYGYSYQAIIRDAVGDPAKNQPVQMRFQILNSANQVQYEETHATTTDAFGRAASVVGRGTAVSGKFDTLNWAARKHYLGVAVKLSGAANWVPLGGKEEVVQPPIAKEAGVWKVIDTDHIAHEGLILESAPNGAGSPNAATFRFGDGTGWNLNFGRWREGVNAPLNSGAEGVLMTLQDNGYLRHKGQLILDLQDKTGSVGRDAIHILASSDNSDGVIAVNKPRLSIWSSSQNDLANFECKDAVVRGSTRIDGADLQLGVNDGRPVGNITEQRALVHDLGDVLKINYNGDFEGGVEVEGPGMKVKTLTITGGDVAEARHPTAPEKLPAGSVVVFDETAQGKIRLTSQPYDKKVAGVISGAGQYFAGVCLLQEELAKGAQPLAQVGTVEVLCIGPVEVGDLLTTSAEPGYAMAVADPLRSIGCTIGKAVKSLKAGEQGLVEMQVEKH